jgi:spore coat protein JB
MDDMYYNDCFNSGFSYENYPVNSNQHSICEPSYRNDGSLIGGERIDSFFNPSEGFAKGNMQSNIYRPYKLTNPSLPPVYNERQRMLLEVQKYGFAMWDLNLYLNTHPTDRNVMMLFDQYRNAYKKAIQDYQSKYGALSVKDATTNGGYWSWNRSPWPWEGE